MGRHLVRAGTPPEVAVLAAMALIKGGACVIVAAVPPVAETPRGAFLVIGLLCLALALALVVAGPRVSTPSLHATLMLFTALISVTVAVAATERGLMMGALSYTWAAVYVAFFYPRRAARLHAALMIAALGASLLAARAATDPSVWLVLSTMIWVAVSIIGGLNARLRAQAHTDDLTGSLNRTGFAVAAVRHRAMAVRRGETVALAVIDLDGFKQVNDRHGHAAGDRLLVELAGAWTDSLRPGDLLARFGGDEFVLMLAEAEEDQAEAVLARLALTHPARWTAGTVVCSDAESLEEAIARADERLYIAKAPRRSAAEPDRADRAAASLEPGRA